MNTAPDLLTAPALALAQVRHRRFHPRAHQFAYEVGYVWLDADQLEATCARSRWWSLNRLNLTSLDPRDLLGAGQCSIREALDTLMQTTLGLALQPDDAIRVLTVPRWLGRTFNPVSFYVVLRAGQVYAIAAEITNTPWGERHSHVFAVPPGERVCRAVFEKDFHVSPFMPMQLVYDWRFRFEPGHSVIHMQLWQAGVLQFDATMQFRLQPLGVREQSRYGLQFAAQGVRMLTAIYWQAAQLWRKGVPFHPHPRKRAVTTAPPASDVLSPPETRP